MTESKFLQSISVGSLPNGTTNTATSDPVRRRINHKIGLRICGGASHRMYREPAQSWLRSCNELSQSFDNSISPFRCSDLPANRGTDLPIEIDQRCIDRLESLLLRGGNQLHHFGECCFVLVCSVQLR